MALELTRVKIKTPDGERWVYGYLADEGGNNEGIVQAFVQLDEEGNIVVPGGEGGGGLTNTQLRAAPLDVSGPLTDTQLRATAVPVSGPLTSAQAAALGLATDAVLQVIRDALLNGPRLKPDHSMVICT